MITIFEKIPIYIYARILLHFSPHRYELQKIIV